MDYKKIIKAIETIEAAPLFLHIRPKFQQKGPPYLHHPIGNRIHVKRSLTGQMTCILIYYFLINNSLLQIYHYNPLHETSWKKRIFPICLLISWCSYTVNPRYMNTQQEFLYCRIFNIFRIKCRVFQGY